MNAPIQPEQAQAAEPRNPDQEAAAKVAASWLNQFARTLKTCRLYDAKNPTVVRFREELGSSLRKALNAEGTLEYSFTSDDVKYGDVSLYPASEHDDNLALAFYRDGIRTIVIKPGIEQRELDAFIDSVLRVTGQNDGNDDLVTLLWEASLEHVDVDYVPGEGDMGAGAGEDTSELVPWPTAGADAAEEETAAPEQAQDESTEGQEGRSDDWTIGDLTVEIEAGYAELDAIGPGEIQRFREEYEAEHSVPTLTATLAICDAFISANPNEEDKSELAAFLPRVLRQAVSEGAWLEAREAMSLLSRASRSPWGVQAFAQELQQPISVSQIIKRIDNQEASQVVDFLAFARQMGDPVVDLFVTLLSESQNRRNRKMLAEAITELCRANPERLAPHLTDSRWYLVRNIVHILGWIGGNQIVGLVESVLRHPEPRVRYEAVSALAKVDARLARPLLLRLVDTTDSRLFTAVLHQLARDRDPQASRLLLSLMLDERFGDRPDGERHAIYSALSLTAGDEVLPELEAELHKTTWFSRSLEPHRQAIARCLARIGTPQARTALERGTQSRRPSVRKACEDALMGLNGRD